jgi:hypothetical protein
MADDPSVPDFQAPDTSDRLAVEEQLRRSGLPASGDEIDELCAIYSVIRGPIAALYTLGVEELLR